MNSRIIKHGLLAFMLYTPLVSKHIELPPAILAGKAEVHSTKVDITLAYNTKNSYLETVSSAILRDMVVTDQLRPKIAKHTKQLSKTELGAYFNKGTTLVVHLEIVGDKVSVLLYDTAQGKMIWQHATKRRDNPVFVGHLLSDELLKKITGESIALSQIAYCKHVDPKGAGRELNQRRSVLCVSDYVCCDEKVLTDPESLATIPAWHSTLPIVFYTEYTKTNNRLMACNLQTRSTSTISSLPGLNMQPSFSPDGKVAIMCLSVKGNSELFQYDHAQSKEKKRNVFKQITNNKGNNTSPMLLGNGDIIFCSDFETTLPQIYYLESGAKKPTRLTKGGFCVSPTYCEKTKRLIFARPVKKVFELFAIKFNKDGTASKARQITFNGGDKTDPSISSCGRYVLFSYAYPKGGKKPVNQVALLNLNSQMIHILTSGPEPKSLPIFRPSH